MQFRFNAMPVDSDTASGMRLELGSLKTSLTIGSAAQFVKDLARRPERVPFFRKLASHPAYSIREWAADKLSDPKILEALLHDRALNVRMAAAERLKELKEPDVPERPYGMPKATFDDEDDLPAVGRLVYEELDCGLTQNDLWNCAWDWRPKQSELANGAFMDAIAETAMWADPEIRRAAAYRCDISHDLALRLFRSSEPIVRGVVQMNIAAWQQLSCKEALEIIGDDPSLIATYFACAEREDDIRCMAEHFIESRDPQISWLARLKLKRPAPESGQTRTAFDLW